MAKRSSRSARLRRKTRRGRVKTLLFSLLFLAIAVTAGVLAVTVFFKIATIEISGKTRYSAAELEQTLGVKTGDNLFLWGQPLGVGKVLETYPYIDTIKVHRKLPDKLILEVKECTPVAALHDGSSWWLIDEQGKLLESVSQQAAQKYFTVEGVKVIGQTAGQTLDPQADSGAGMVLLEMMKVLRDNDYLKHVTFLNLNRLYQIHMGYDKRFDVWLGTVDSLDHKLKFLSTIIKQKLSPSDIGVIDLSDNTSARFQPETAQQVAAAKTSGAVSTTTTTTATTSSASSTVGASQSGTSTATASSASQGGTASSSTSAVGASQGGSTNTAGTQSGGITE